MNYHESSDESNITRTLMPTRGLIMEDSPVFIYRVRPEHMKEGHYEHDAIYRSENWLPPFQILARCKEADQSNRKAVFGVFYQNAFLLDSSGPILLSNRRLNVSGELSGHFISDVPEKITFGELMRTPDLTTFGSAAGKLFTRTMQKFYYTQTGCVTLVVSRLYECERKAVMVRDKPTGINVILGSRMSVKLSPPSKFNQILMTGYLDAFAFLGVRPEDPVIEINATAAAKFLLGIDLNQNSISADNLDRLRDYKGHTVEFTEFAEGMTIDDKIPNCKETFREYYTRVGAIRYVKDNRQKIVKVRSGWSVLYYPATALWPISHYETLKKLYAGNDYILNEVARLSKYVPEPAVLKDKEPNEKRHETIQQRIKCTYKYAFNVIKHAYEPQHEKDLGQKFVRSQQLNIRRLPAPQLQFGKGQKLGYHQIFAGLGRALLHGGVYADNLSTGQRRSVLVDPILVAKPDQKLGQHGTVLLAALDYFTTKSTSNVADVAFRDMLLLDLDERVKAEQQIDQRIAGGNSNLVVHFASDQPGTDIYAKTKRTAAAYNIPSQNIDRNKIAKMFTVDKVKQKSFDEVCERIFKWYIWCFTEKRKAGTPDEVLATQKHYIDKVGPDIERLLLFTQFKSTFLNILLGVLGKLGFQVWNVAHEWNFEALFAIDFSRNPGETATTAGSSVVQLPGGRFVEQVLPHISAAGETMTREGARTFAESMARTIVKARTSTANSGRVLFIHDGRLHNEDEILDIMVGAFREFGLELSVVNFVKNASTLRLYTFENNENGKKFKNSNGVVATLEDGKTAYLSLTNPAAAQGMSATSSVEQVHSEVEFDLIVGDLYAASCAHVWSLLKIGIPAVQALAHKTSKARSAGIALTGSISPLWCV